MNEGSPFWNWTSSTSQSTQPERHFYNLPPANLVTPRRWDLAVKWRFARHLLGGNDADADRVYRWHLQKRLGARMAAGLPCDGWKTSVDDYVRSAIQLVQGMQWCGLRDPVPIDPSGELLNGAHRVACALALGLGSIPVVREMRQAWAPAWGYDWFVQNGMSEGDLQRLRSDWREMRDE
jgi:hypothetical protein